LRFGLDEFALASGSGLARALNALLFFRSLREPRGARLRRMMITIGAAISAMAIDPIFISLRDVADFQACGGETRLPPASSPAVTCCSFAWGFSLRAS